MAQCLISFGSNLGDRLELIRAAAQRISEDANVQGIQCARLFETPSVGGPSGQGAFLNTVAVIETSYSTEEVLSLLQSTEQSLGRVRKQRWDERSIDLDVVLYGDFVGESFRLKLPHPRYTARSFVLTPALDVAGHWRDPRFDWSLAQLHEHLCAGPASIALEGGQREFRRELCRRVQSLHGVAARIADRAEMSVSVVGHAPLAAESRTPPSAESDSSDWSTGKPWIADYVPDSLRSESPTQRSGDLELPRLIARLHHTSLNSRWPAPYSIHRNGWNWPEYRLEVDDVDWAVGELAAAIDSMQCRVQPVTTDGRWIEG